MRGRNSGHIGTYEVNNDPDAPTNNSPNFKRQWNGKLQLLSFATGKQFSLHCLEQSG
jgi:hypothetical protein